MARKKSSKAPREKTTRKVTPGATVKKKAIARAEKAVTGSDINGRSVFFAPLERLPCSDDTLRTAISDITERTRAEEALLASKEQFRRAIENAPIPMIMHAEDGQVLQVSRTWTELTGFRAEDMQTFEAWLNRAYGEGADAVREHVRQLFKGTRRSINVDFPIRTKDDRIRHWSFSASAPGTLVDGRRFVVGMAIDVTERKKAEEELRRTREEVDRHANKLAVRNEELLRTQMDLEAARTEYFHLFNFAPVGYFTFDEGGTISAANVTGASQLGVERASLLRQPFAQSVVEEDRPRFLAHLKEVFGSAERKECELRLLGRNHSELFVRMESVALDEGFEGRVRCLTAVSDITARKKAEEALRQSEERFRIIASSTPDHLLVQDSDRRYTLVLNPQLGLTEQDMLGKTDEEILASPDDAARLTEIKRKVLETGESIRVNVPLRAADGRTAFFEGSYVPKRDVQGHVDGLIGYFRNVTERKRAEEALERMRILLSEGQKIAHLGSFEYVVATGETIWSDEEFRIYGLEPGQKSPNYAELMQKHFHPDDAARVDEKFKATLQSGSFYEIEHRIILPDGSIRDLYNVAQPYFDNQGRLVKYIGATLDITERKRADEALRRSEARYRDLVQNANSAIIRWNRDGTITFFNEYAQTFFGYRLDEVLGRNVSILVPEVDSSGGNLQHLVQDIVDHPARYVQNVNENVCRDGRRVWMAWTNKPIHDGQGNVKEILAIAMDITERKQAEEAARAISDRYRSYIELTGQLGWTTNADGEVVEDMPSWRAFTGQTHDEVAGWGWSNALHPDDLERTSQKWRKAVEEKTPYEVEYRIRRHDGVYRHFMARGIPVLKEDGSIREWVGTCIDITERKDAEEALRRAKDELEVRVRERTEELVKANKELEEENAVRRRAEKAVVEQSRILESFFMHTHTCLVFLNRDFNFIRVNEAYARACAREVSDFIGHNHFVDYPSDELKEKFQRVVDTGEPYKVFGRPFVFPDHPDWGVTYWDLAVAPILDVKGEVEFLVFSLLDVTERKRAEEEINNLNRELEQRVKARTAELQSVNRELEAFSYTVSHDLKTPLRSIEGFTRALMEDYAGKLDDAGRDYLDRVNAASKRMSQLIEAMLTISRLTKGELVERTVNLSDMAQVKADELKRKEPGRKVEFIIAQGLKARGDHSMLALVVENLFENAWKFTGRHESATIEFGVTQREGQTVYYVRDDGAGFDMDYADKLFLPFRRLHLESEFPGLGIGLATVYRIISRHGGKIWAEGAPEKGATVYFSLG